MRVMYDAVTASNCPDDGDLYAGYVDGHWQSYPDMVTMFPGKTHVSIAVFASTEGAQVYDVEQGDLTAGQVPGVLQRERAAGRNPTMYVNLSNWHDCVMACNNAGLTPPPWWVAHYTGQAHLEPGSVACQWNDPGPYDISQVADFWPGIDPAPTPAPPTTSPLKDGKMRHDLTISTDPQGNGYADLAVDFSQVESVFPNGADPATNHGYSPIPRLAPLLEGSGTRVVLEGGPPNGLVLVHVTAAT